MLTINSASHESLSINELSAGKSRVKSLLESMMRPESHKRGQSAASQQVTTSHKVIRLDRTPEQLYDLRVTA